MNLKEILENHKNMKLPSFPNDDNFTNWVEELIDLDAYYYGIAISFLSGEKKAYDNSLFEDMKHRLCNFKNLHDDQCTYQECVEYLNSLEKIIELINLSIYKK